MSSKALNIVREEVDGAVHRARWSQRIPNIERVLLELKEKIARRIETECIQPVSTVAAGNETL